MGIDRPGHMQLGAPDNHAVIAAFDNMDVLIRIGLIGRCFGSVAFGVGHGADHHQIFILNVGEPFFKAFKIIRAVFLVDFIGHRINGVDPVKSDTTLKTRAGFLPENPQQFDFFDQIFDVLMDMGKPADGSTRLEWEVAVARSLYFSLSASA